MYTLLTIILLATLFTGAALIYNGWRDRRDPTAPKRQRRTGTRISRKSQLLLLAGIGVGALFWMITGWFIAIILSPALFVGLPYFLGRPAAEGEIARLNAMEEWVRNLAGVLAVGTGIEQAIIATHRAIPAPLRDEIGRLIQRLRANTPIKEALYRFASDLDDATGDLVCGALIQSAVLRGDGLSSVLDRLSRSVAEDVRNRRAVEAARKGHRTTARWVTIITVGFIVALFVFTDYMAFYKSPPGQILFVLLMAAFGAILWWMKLLTRTARPPRFIGTTRRTSPPAEDIETTLMRTTA